MTNRQLSRGGSGGAARAPQRSMLAMPAAMAAFVGSDATVASFTSVLKIGEPIALRGLFATAIIGAGVMMTRPVPAHDREVQTRNGQSHARFKLPRISPRATEHAATAGAGP